MGLSHTTQFLSLFFFRSFRGPLIYEVNGLLGAQIVMSGTCPQITDNPTVGFLTFSFSFRLSFFEV